MIRKLFSSKKKEASEEVPPEDDPNSFGNIAIELGYITIEELKEALRVQAKRLQLGEILIEMGKLTSEQRDELVMEQKIRKGEIDDPDTIRKFERTKLQHRLCALKDNYKEAGKSAQALTASIATQTKVFGK